MERRTFLGGLTAASFESLLESAFAAPAQSLTSNKTGGSMAGQDGFESSLVDIPGNTIFVRRYGKGPAIPAHGRAIKGGHFFPEENPDGTAALVNQFLSA